MEQGRGPLLHGRNYDPSLLALPRLCSNLVAQSLQAGVKRARLQGQVRRLGRLRRQQLRGHLLLALGARKYMCRHVCACLST